MKKYIVFNFGCDDYNDFYINLTKEELDFVIKFIEKNNKVACSRCTPHLFIFECDENKNKF